MSFTLKPTSIPPKTLAQPITSASASFVLDNILGFDGNALTAADFGSEAYAVFSNSTGTRIELMKIDASTIASAAITISLRGLPFTGGYTEVTANKLDWPANETTVLIGANPPQLYQEIIDYINAVALAGAPNASTTLQGLLERATVAEVNAGTENGSTGAALAVNPADLAASNYGLNLPSATEKLFIGAATGVVLPYVGLSAPSGFLLCDGAAYDCDTYTALAVVAAGRFGLGTLVTFTAESGADLLTAVSHGLANGSIVFLKAAVGATMPTGLSENTPYYIINQTTNTFQVSTTSGGSAVNFSSNGSGTLYFSNSFKVPDFRGRMMLGYGTGTKTYDFVPADVPQTGTAFTATASDDCNATGHGLVTGDVVFLTNSGGALPAGLSTATPYYVRKANDNVFYLHTSYENALNNYETVNITGTGTGTHSFLKPTITIPSNSDLYTGRAVALTNSGGGLPTGLSATTYYVIRLSATSVMLASSRQNAIDRVAIQITGQGTGTHTLTLTLTARSIGDMGGEDDHTLTTPELPSHWHNQQGIPGAADGVAGSDGFSVGGYPSATIGSDEAMNIMSPFTGINFIIKT